MVSLFGFISDSRFAWELMEEVEVVMAVLEVMKALGGMCGRG